MSSYLQTWEMSLVSKEKKKTDSRDQSLSSSNPTFLSIYRNVGECAIRLD